MFICGAVSYVCCLLCYWSSVWTLDTQIYLFCSNLGYPNLFIFRQVFFFKVFLWARCLQNEFFRPIIRSDRSRYKMKFNVFFVVLIGFERQGEKHILILQIHKSITIIFLKILAEAAIPADANLFCILPVIVWMLIARLYACFIHHP